MSYKLILADGTELDNLTMNGNTLISETEVTNEMLSDESLEEVTMIETDEQGNEKTTVYRYAHTNGVFHEADGYHFVIWGAGPSEIEIRNLKADNEMLIECILEMSEIIYGE